MEAVSLNGAFRLRSKFNLKMCNYQNYIPNKALTLFSSTLAMRPM